MPHRGRPYPVAYRRDFNLGLQTNNTGWAQSYEVTLRNLGPGPGGGLAGKPFVCGPDTFASPQSIFWTSAPEIMFGFVFVVEARIAITDGIHIDRNIFVIEAVNGVVLHLIYDDAQFSKTAGFPDVLWHSVFQDQFFFPTPITRSDSTLFALGYDGSPV